MTISISVKRLSDILASYIRETTNDLVLLDFVTEIGSMPTWIKRQDLPGYHLPEWEYRVQHHEINWEEREESKDEIFLLALEIFDLGRYNMYTSIKEEETRIEYNRVKTLIKSTTSCEVPEDTEFDFGRW